MKIYKQISKDAHWKDEQGNNVPYNRTTALERTKEQLCFKIAKEALALNNELVNYKKMVAKEAQEIYALAMADAKPGKGNFTFYNFDMSIKVEVQINDNIEFDSIVIEQAKQLLLELIEESISADKAFIKDLVLSAFQNTKGSLDTKKVLGLKKHASKIKDTRYHEAMRLIDTSIRIPSSKTYYRVWVKDELGKFQNIDLNLSSIEA